MPKFNVGDKVVFATDKLIAPQDFTGRSGKVTEVYAAMQVQNKPGDPWVPTYMIQFEGEDDAMLVEDDWPERG